MLRPGAPLLHYDRVQVPEISALDMLDDAFTGIARDGRGGDGGGAPPEGALLLSADKDKIRRLAAFATPATRAAQEATEPILLQPPDSPREHRPQELHMGILATIVIGLIVGAIARFLMPGKQSMGWIMTCLLGIGGSVVAGFLGRALGWYQSGQAVGWIASVVGALILLFVVQTVRGGKAAA